MPNICIDGICYKDMPFRQRQLKETNPNLVKAEREFIAGKRWTEIKVRHNLWVIPNLSYEDDWPIVQLTGPRKVKGDKVL